MLGLRRFLLVSVVMVVRLPLDRPDIGRLLLERIHVHHPSENLRHEFATGGITIFFG